MLFCYQARILLFHLVCVPIKHSGHIGWCRNSHSRQRTEPSIGRTNLSWKKCRRCLVGFEPGLHRARRIETGVLTATPNQRSCTAHNCCPLYWLDHTYIRHRASATQQLQVLRGYGICYALPASTRTACDLLRRSQVRNLNNTTVTLLVGTSRSNITLFLFSSIFFIKIRWLRR